jgi:hypothetical protein
LPALVYFWPPRGSLPGLGQTIALEAPGTGLHDASAPQRGYKAVVPVDGMSSESAFNELYAAWHIAKGGPANLVGNATLTRSDLIKFGN